MSLIVSLGGDCMVQRYDNKIPFVKGIGIFIFNTIDRALPVKGGKGFTSL